MEYRTEAYFEYLKLHRFEIYGKMKENKGLILFAILVFVGMSISSLPFEVLTPVFYSMLFFFVYGLGIFPFLFFMTLHYKIYNRSSEQFKAINPFVLSQKLDVDIYSYSTKIPFKTIFNNSGEPIDEMIKYDFDKADVFETEKSIFLFPKRTSEGQGIVTEYLPPIRFQSDMDEKITGIYDLYTINKFTKELDGENIELEFHDKKYEIDVRIVIVKNN